MQYISEGFSWKFMAVLKRAGVLEGQSCHTWAVPAGQAMTERQSAGCHISSRTGLAPGMMGMEISPSSWHWGKNTEQTCACEHTGVLCGAGWGCWPVQAAGTELWRGVGLKPKGGQVGTSSTFSHCLAAPSRGTSVGQAGDGDGKVLLEQVRGHHEGWANLPAHQKAFYNHMRCMKPYL